MLVPFGRALLTIIKRKGEMVKIKIEVDDTEFPEWPPFPEYLVLMWTGIQEEMQNRLLWFAVMAGPVPAMIVMSQCRRKS